MVIYDTVDAVIVELLKEMELLSEQVMPLVELRAPARYCLAYR